MRARPTYLTPASTSLSFLSAFGAVLSIFSVIFGSSFFFFGLNYSTSGLTTNTTFGYSPFFRYSLSSAGFYLPGCINLFAFLSTFSTSPAHASCGNLYALSASTPPPFPLQYPSIISAITITRPHLLYALRLNLLVPAITFRFSTSFFRTFVEGGPPIGGPARSL